MGSGANRGVITKGELTGRAAVVTGDPKGVGATIAKSLAREGAPVVVNYSSSKAGADSTVAAIRSDLASEPCTGAAASGRRV